MKFKHQKKHIWVGYLIAIQMQPAEFIIRYNMVLFQDFLGNFLHLKIAKNPHKINLENHAEGTAERILGAKIIFEAFSSMTIKNKL